MATHNTVDNSFKLIFGDHRLFSDFLRDFIHIDILKEVKPEDIEDISERFLPLFQNNRDSDTVKRINLKGSPLFVIAILEHESKVNHRSCFKMLQYICLVLDAWEKPELQGLFFELAENGKALSVERIRLAAPEATVTEENADDETPGD